MKGEMQFRKIDPIWIETKIKDGITSEAIAKRFSLSIPELDELLKIYFVDRLYLINILKTNDQRAKYAYLEVLSEIRDVSSLMYATVEPSEGIHQIISCMTTERVSCKTIPTSFTCYTTKPNDFKNNHNT